MTLLELAINNGYYTKVEEVVKTTITNTTETIETYPHRNSKGVMYNLPQTSIDKLVDLSTSGGTASYTEIHKLSKLFKVHTIKIEGMNRVSQISLFIKLLSSQSVYGLIAFDIHNAPVNVGNFISITSKALFEEKLVTLAVYSYVEEEVLVPTEYVTKEVKLLATIDSLINSTAYNHRDKKASEFNLNSHSGHWNIEAGTLSASIDSTASIILPSTEEREYTLIPHLFLSKGIIVPYYGFSYMWTTPAGRYGDYLTSMLTPNISKSSGSICVGSNPRDEYDSYRSLNYANLDSPYFKDVFPNSYKHVAEANKQFTIIKLKGVLDEQEPTESTTNVTGEMPF